MKKFEIDLSTIPILSEIESISIKCRMPVSGFSGEYIDNPFGKGKLMNNVTITFTPTRNGKPYVVKKPLVVVEVEG